MHILKVRKFGDDAGVAIPPEALTKLGCTAGDRLVLMETPGGLHLIPYDPAFAAFERTRGKYRRAFRDLAD